MLLQIYTTPFAVATYIAVQLLSMQKEAMLRDKAHLISVRN